LIGRPRGHDGPIVHTIHNNVVDTQLLEVSLFGQVSGNLATGSGGCKGTGQTDNQDILAFEAIVQLDGFGRKAVVQGQSFGKVVTDVNGVGECCQGRQDCEEKCRNLHDSSV